MRLYIHLWYVNRVIMSLRFYTDTHIPKQVAIQLRNKGIDVIRCEDVQLAEVDDETHLNYAINNQLCIITKDDDFLSLHAKLITTQRSHHGIFFCRKRDNPAIGEIVATCVEYYDLIESEAGSGRTSK